MKLLIEPNSTWTHLEAADLLQAVRAALAAAAGIAPAWATSLGLGEVGGRSVVVIGDALRSDGCVLLVAGSDPWRFHEPSDGDLVLLAQAELAKLVPLGHA